MKNKIRCPCCGNKATTIQVGLSGNHNTYTLIDELIYDLVCTDCGYDSRECNDNKLTFYSELELINYFE